MPANASLRGMIAFQDRPGINVTFLLPAKAAKEAIDLLQLVSDYVVVIVSPGVPRDLTRSWCSCVLVRRVPLKIIQCQSNYRPCARQNLLRIATFLFATLHVTHLAVRPMAQPLTKFSCVRRRIAGGSATGIKPDLSRKRDQPG